MKRSRLSHSLFECIPAFRESNTQCSKNLLSVHKPPDGTAEKNAVDDLIVGWSVLHTLQDYSVDHLHAYAVLCSQRDVLLPCCNIVRSTLEACARGIWIADPVLSVPERVGRILALRFEWIRQQQKIANADPADRGDTLAQLSRRCLRLETKARQVGLSPRKKPDGTIKDLGLSLPGATDLIENQLGRGLVYRLLSAPAHGHPSAILSLVHNRWQPVGVPTGASTTVLASEKEESDELLSYLAWVLLESTARLFLSVHKMADADAGNLQQRLSMFCDEAGIRSDARFWE